MRWFVISERGAGMPWKEWDKAVEDPEDMLASIALGERAYRACMRAARLPPRKEAKNAITAFAHILHHMLDEMEEGELLELRYVLQERWMGSAPGLWEPPTEAIWPMGNDLRLELLSLRHGLERVVGPELLRLYWAGTTAAGRRVPVRSMEAGTGPGFPLMLLDRMRAENVPAFLDDEEREGLGLLRSELTLSDLASTDDLAAGLSRQRQVSRRGRLYIEGSGGGWFRLEEVRSWRERVLRSSSLLLAFRVMFLASVTGESGPLRPAFPD